MFSSHNTLPKTVFPFIWRYLRPKWPNLLLILMGPIVWAIVTTINPYLLKWVIDTVITFEGNTKDVWTVAWVPVLAFVGTALLLDLTMRCEEYMTLQTIPQVKANLRAGMFDYVQHHAHSYFQDHLAGSLSNKVLDMVRGFENMFTSAASVFLPIALHCLLTAGLLLTVHWWYSLFIISWFLLYMTATAIFSKRCIPLSDEHSKANSTLSGRIVDAFRNMPTIRLFAHHRFENRDLGRYQDKEVSHCKRLKKALLYIHIFQGCASTLLMSVALLLFITLWSKGTVTVGDFTYVTSTTFSLMILSWWMAEQFVVFFQEYGVSRQALSLITIPHGVVDAPNARKLTISKGEIRFYNVTFGYSTQTNLFSDLNLTIRAGEKVGLVGFSGSGKSSLVHLILRYYDLKSGTITVDGQNISRVTQESLRSQIAMIPQEATLFHRSLMENIRYGRLEATDDEVRNAARKARCHDFIMQLENQYDSLVGESGVKLSGGQRQRVAIARAILKDAPILILDEATSALDSVTEVEIQQSLEVAMEGRTTLVIAHRLSTIAKLDRVIVLDHGIVVEQGTHQELLAQNGRFAHLWSMQNRAYGSVHDSSYQLHPPCDGHPMLQFSMRESQ